MFARIAKALAPKKIHLGRWEHCETLKQKEIKSIWANSDNCGDKICGNPQLIKNITEIKTK